jgi:hypothetical protein
MSGSTYGLSSSRESLQVALAISNSSFFVVQTTGLVSTPYGGKGAFNCQQSPFKIVAWSMARQPFLRSDLPIYGLLVVLITLAGGIGLYRWRRKAR